MKLADVITIPLREAYLCADETPHIGNDPHRCPVCSSQVVSLAWMLEAPATKAKWMQAAGMVQG